MIPPLDNLLFAKYLAQPQSEDGAFIEMYVDGESTASLIQPQKLTIIESVDTFSYQVILEFIDGTGDLVNAVPFNTDNEFTLVYGTSPDNNIRLDLKITKITHMNLRMGSNDRVSFKLFFLFKDWDKIFNKTYLRGWSGKKTSQIISDICSSIYPTTDIEQTTSDHETYVQPYTTNSEILTKLIDQAKPVSGSHFEHALRTDGVFMCTSYNKLVKDAAPKAESFELPLFVMEGDTGRKDVEFEANYRIPHYFSSLTVISPYAKTAQDVGGTRHSYYDVETDRYVVTDVTVNSLDSFQLSDWSHLKQSNSNNMKMFHGGRHSVTENDVRNKISKKTSEFQTVSLETEASFNLHVGDMVEVIIPTPADQRLIEPINLFYSGFYIVKQVVQNFDFNNLQKTSRITLTREGFDDTSMQGYARTQKGKFTQ